MSRVPHYPGIRIVHPDVWVLDVNGEFGKRYKFFRSAQLFAHFTPLLVLDKLTEAALHEGIEFARKLYPKRLFACFESDDGSRRLAKYFQGSELELVGAFSNATGEDRQKIIEAWFEEKLCAIEIDSSSFLAGLDRKKTWGYGSKPPSDDHRETILQQYGLELPDTLEPNLLENIMHSIGRIKEKKGPNWLERYLQKRREVKRESVFTKNIEALPQYMPIILSDMGVEVHIGNVSRGSTIESPGAIFSPADQIFIASSNIANGASLREEVCHKLDRYFGISSDDAFKREVHRVLGQEGTRKAIEKMDKGKDPVHDYPKESQPAELLASLDRVAGPQPVHPEVARELEGKWRKLFGATYDAYLDFVRRCQKEAALISRGGHRPADEGGADRDVSWRSHVTERERRDDGRANKI